MVNEGDTMIGSDDRERKFTQVANGIELKAFKFNSKNAHNTYFKSKRIRTRKY